MPAPTPSLSGPRWILAVALVTLLALGAGWWLGLRQGRQRTDVDPKRSLLTREVGILRLRYDKGEASATDQQRLLELLVGLDRKTEAIALLETMADREPDRWSLRLMLAELRRGQNDLPGAEREVRQILSRQPDQVEALQLFSLLQAEQGRLVEAETIVKATYGTAIKPDPKPQAMGIGLLLGELLQKRGHFPQAEALYQELATAFPRDQRPLLAMALLRQQRGNIKGAQEALSLARQRGPDPGKPDPRLDDLAASWGLAALRAQPGVVSPPQTRQAGSGRRNP